MAESNLIDTVDIRSILTLRYDKSLKSTLPKLSWKDFTPNEDNISKNIESAIVNNIKNSLSTKKASIALSGGIDSILILTLLRKHFPDLEINALSLKFADSEDETPQAKKIAEHFDINHKTVFLENFLIELPKAISIIKAPFWDLHWYHITKNAKLFSDCLISGDGGDELFGGYTFRYKKFLSLVNNESTPKKRVEAYLQCHQRDWVNDQEKLFGKKSQFSWERINEILLPFFNNSLPLLEQIFLADYNGKLIHNFNPINSSINNYFGINNITPILSDEIISFATHIPSIKKYDTNTNVGKLLLRQILAQCNKENLTSNTKQGFSVNTINLWKSHGYKLSKQYLENSRIVKDGWINDEWVQKYLNRLIDNPDIRIINKFLGLLAFEIWYRIFVTKEMNSNETLDV